MFNLSKDLLSAQKSLLRNCSAIVFCYDNYLRGQHLKFQRGGHSSSFLKGMHEIAHKTILWEDMTYDDKFVPLTHTHDQPYLSPHHVYPYKTLNEFKYGDFLANKQSATREEIDTFKPDFTGSRIDAYI